jgi:hypothetical protein
MGIASITVSWTKSNLAARVFYQQVENGAKNVAKNPGKRIKNPTAKPLAANGLAQQDLKLNLALGSQ